MADFKSEPIDAVSSYSYIPTGGIITLAGPLTDYDDSSLVNGGLIPCDGRTLNSLVSTLYSNLFSVIGTLYGGIGPQNFNVPNLKDNKLTIVGTSNTFYNTNTVGTKLASYTHGHSVSMYNNNFSMNAANVTHSHNYVFNSVGNISQNNHTHGTNSAAAAMGGSQKNGPAGTAGGGLIGNHVHNYSVNANIHGAAGLTDHTHPVERSASSGNAGDASHSHTSSAVSSGNSGDSTIDGTASFPISVPYANVLYFIKA
jgi:microcystin-dependent protein